MKRKIIKIDETLCTGCGSCIPNCPEGALQVIDGKARLISDLFCDGLGACIGNCPESAILIEEREAEPYDERRVMKNIVKMGTNTIKAHLDHLLHHNETKLYDQAVRYLKETNIPIPPKPKELEHLEHEKIDHDHIMHNHIMHNHSTTNSNNQDGIPNIRLFSCPGSASRKIERKNISNENVSSKKFEGISVQTSILKEKSKLINWPVQLMLVPTKAAYFDNSNLLISADCVPFAYGSFHSDFVDGHTLIMGCPKLDDVSYYLEKLVQIFKNNNIKHIKILTMEVPCCSGLTRLVNEAIQISKKEIPLENVTINIDGSIKN